MNDNIIWIMEVQGSKLQLTFNGKSLQFYTVSLILAMQSSFVVSNSQRTIYSGRLLLSHALLLW